MSGRAGAGGGGSGRPRRAEGDERGEQQRREPRTVPEWITLAVSSLIVLTVAAFIVYEQLKNAPAPPAFDVRPDFGKLRLEGDRYYLPVVARNTGERTAEDVRIRLTLTPAAASGPEQAEKESSEFQIRYFSGGARIEAVAVFRHDPRRGDLTVDIVSYLKP